MEFILTVCQGPLVFMLCVCLVCLEVLEEGGRRFGQELYCMLTLL